VTARAPESFTLGIEPIAAAPQAPNQTVIIVGVAVAAVVIVLLALIFIRRGR
jgi:hypothetical protein